MRRAACVLLAWLAVPVPGEAQSEVRDARVGADVAVAVGTFIAADEKPANFVTIDSVSNTRLLGSLTLVARPVVRKRTGAEWDPTLAQLVVRHEAFGRVARRIDVGYLAPPAGLASLEIRASDNPTISPALPYGEGLPKTELGAPSLRLYAPTYPLGAQASFSATRWDTRVGVVDSSLLRTRAPFESEQPARAPQIVLGGGVTPRTGLRMGGWFSSGTYLRASERLPLPGVTRDDEHATLTGVEAELAVGWTRVAGEWVHASLEMGTSREPATLFMVEATRTLAPRWYLAGRMRTIDAPDRLSRSGPGARARSTTAEATLGYRVSRDLSLRTGYQLVRGFRDDGYAHRAGFSMVWAHRWL
jgi:hypothetical protein